MPERLDLFYENNPLYNVDSSASSSAVRRVAWFDSDQPLRSGWAWGQQYLRGAVAVAETRVGSGTLVLIGPLVAFRAHPHATFKFLFNAVYYGIAKTVTLGAAEPAK
jgi:hypothetical protein